MKFTMEEMKPGCASVLQEAEKQILDGISLKDMGDALKGSEMAIKGLFAIAPLVRCHKFNEMLPCASACRSLCSDMVCDTKDMVA
ncbi:MAG: hypothetical protein OEW37_09575 [Rhodospirillaceae bacterium]|nr:hypothetical protein [Rhodospirillaceae bacterium]